MRKLRGTTWVVALLTFALIVTACSKDKESATSGDGATAAPATTYTADDYATAVCGALGTWLDDIQTSAGNMPTPTNPKDAKDVVVQFLDGLVTSTDTMISTVEDANSQYSEGDADAKAAIQESLTNVKTIFEQARDTIKGLSTSDPQAFAQALQDVGNSMQQAASEATSSLDGITDEQLNGAFATNTACTSLQGTMGSASPAA